MISAVADMGLFFCALFLIIMFVIGTTDSKVQVFLFPGRKDHAYNSNKTDDGTGIQDCFDPSGLHEKASQSAPDHDTD